MEKIKANREEIAIQAENHKMQKTTLTNVEQREVKNRTNKRKKELILAGRNELWHMMNENSNTQLIKQKWSISNLKLEEGVLDCNGNQVKISTGRKQNVYLQRY